MVTRLENCKSILQLSTARRVLSHTDTSCSSRSCGARLHQQCLYPGPGVERGGATWQVALTPLEASTVYYYFVGCSCLPSHQRRLVAGCALVLMTRGREVICIATPPPPPPPLPDEGQASHSMVESVTLARIRRTGTARTVFTGTVSIFGIKHVTYHDWS